MPRWLVPLAIAVPVLVGAWLFLRGTNTPSGVTASSPTDWNAGATPQPPAAPIEDRARTLVPSVPPTTPHEPAEAASEGVVAGGGVLAGVVRVNGATPHEPLELEIVSATEDVRDFVTTDSWGRFRREDLPADWSGKLVLPVPYRMNLDEFSTRNSVEIPRLREDLVIDVDRPGVLKLQVLREDRSPAEGAMVTIRQQHGSGSRDVGAHADRRGMAWADIAGDSLGQVHADVQLDDGAHGEAFFEAGALSPSEPFGDIDLGVLVLRSGRQVRLRCLESDGTPLGGLRLWVHGAGRRSVLTTDEAGVVRVGLPRPAVEVRVEAFGHRLARSTVPAEVDEHDVVLLRANLLRVEVVDAQDRPWPGGKLRVVADRPPFGEDSPFPPGFRVSRKGGVSAGRDGQGVHHCDVPLDENGVAEVPGLAPGLDFEAQVTDSLGQAIVSQRVPGLSETESRTLTLRLPRDPCALDVRVVDAAGQGVASAEVAIRGDRGGVASPTSAEGTIRFEHVFATRVRLVARHTNLQEQVLEDVDPCAGPVTLTLQSGRSLEVELRDDAGRPVAAGWLSMLDLSGERSFSVTQGTKRFDGLPFEPLVLVWTLGSDRRELPIDAAQQTAVLEVPRLGEVSVSANAWQRVDRDRLRVRFERLEPDGGSSEMMFVSPTSQVAWLLPGRYRVTAEVLSLVSGAPPRRLPFGAERELHVAPDSRQSLELTP